MFTKARVVSVVLGLIIAAVSVPLAMNVFDQTDPTSKSIRRLSDPDRTVRLAAAAALGAPDAAQADRVVDPLVEALFDDDYEVRGEAARSLARVVTVYRSRLMPSRVTYACESADPRLAVRVADERTEEAARIESLRLMSRMDRKPYMDMGFAAMGHAFIASSEAVREAAARESVHYGAFSRSIVPSLADLLRDPSERVRRAAAWSLSRFDPIDPTAASKLLVLLDDPEIDDDRRRALTWALGSVKPAPPEVVRRLTATVADPASPLRGVAAAALGKIGSPAAEPAMPSLRAAASDRDPFVHARAARAAAAIMRGQARAAKSLPTDGAGRRP